LDFFALKETLVRAELAIYKIRKLHYILNILADIGSFGADLYFSHSSPLVTFPGKPGDSFTNLPSPNLILQLLR
jgi:hypothetical protein